MGFPRVPQWPWQRLQQVGCVYAEQPAPGSSVSSALVTRPPHTCPSSCRLMLGEVTLGLQPRKSVDSLASAVRSGETEACLGITLYKAS